MSKSAARAITKPISAMKGTVSDLIFMHQISVIGRREPRPAQDREVLNMQESDEEI